MPDLSPLTVFMGVVVGTVIFANLVVIGYLVRAVLPEKKHA